MANRRQWRERLQDRRFPIAVGDRAVHNQRFENSVSGPQFGQNECIVVQRQRLARARQVVKLAAPYRFLHPRLSQLVDIPHRQKNIVATAVLPHPAGRGQSRQGRITLANQQEYEGEKHDRANVCGPYFYGKF